MITLTILLIIAAVLITFTMLALVGVSAVGLIVFADVIVCVAIIVFIVRHFIKKKED